MQSVTLIGATGSIGTQTLEVIDAHPECFRVVALAAHSDVTSIMHQCIRYRPDYVALEYAHAASLLEAQLQQHKLTTKLVCSNNSVADMVRIAESDITVCAATGSAGVRSFHAALQNGKRVLLANKEALVMAGAFFYQWLSASQASVIPIDSEHYAIMQALGNVDINCYPLVQKQMGVDSIVLTASGGAFLDYSAHQLRQVTPKQASAHPNWAMGQKITIDSATMMNKALEVIEAYWLFGLPPESIKVYIHPTSVIHGMVVYNSGSVVAQMSEPDMHIPIAGGLGYPNVLPNVPKANNEWSLRTLEDSLSLQLRPLDTKAFPAVSLARAALATGGGAPIALNAANEMAVRAFCNEQIAFVDIVPLVTQLMNSIDMVQLDSIDAAFTFDAHVREITQNMVHTWH